jgi:5-hydroxyisourate hydrolase-like protein (transthyretin family)
LPKDTHVELSIYNTIGQRVTTLIDDFQSAGKYQIQWKPSTLASGLYILSFKAGNYHKIEKALYVK